MNADLLWIMFRAGFMARHDNRLDTDLPIELLTQRELDSALHDHFESWLARTPTTLG